MTTPKESRVRIDWQTEVRAAINTYRHSSYINLIAGDYYKSGSQAPDPVTGFSGTSNTFDTITATWTDSISINVDYISLRLDGVEAAQIAPGVQTYDFTGLTESTEYTISAIVFDTSGNQSSEVSDIVTTITSSALATGWYDKTSTQTVYDLSDMPTPMRLGSASWDAVTEKFYIPGPYTGSGYSDFLYTYDPVTGVWGSINLGTAGMQGGNGNFIQDRVLLYGPDQGGNGDVYGWNVDTETNEGLIINNPGPGDEPAPHRLGSMDYDPATKRIYMVGDKFDDRGMDVWDATDILNPVALRHRRVPNGDHGNVLYPGIATFINGKFYMMESNSGRLITYDYSTDTFDTSLAGLTIANNSIHLVEYDGDLLALVMHSSLQFGIYKYDISADTWSTITESPITFASMPITTIKDNEIWFFGGHDGSVTIDTIQVYAI